jgi:hypothetical protein
MMGFIELFDLQRENTLQFTITYTHTSIRSHVFTSRCLAVGSTADVPLPLGSRNVPGLNYQVLTRDSSQHLKRISPLTHQPILH